MDIRGIEKTGNILKLVKRQILRTWWKRDVTGILPNFQHGQSGVFHFDGEHRWENTLGKGIWEIEG